MAESVASELTKQAAQAPTKLGIAVLFIKAGYDFLKDFYHQYGDAELRQIEGLRTIYQEECYDTEENYVALTYAATQEKLADLKDRYPVYFKMDEQDLKVPLLFQQNFRVTRPSIWLRCLAKGHLKQSIEQVINYISEYQHSYNNRMWGKGYSYDPVNLFFEELKFWFVELSKCTISDDKTLTLVEKRINYLRRILEERIFPEDKSLVGVVFTRQQVIHRVIDELELAIKLDIVTAISRKSAREHFDSMRIAVKSLISNSMEFLFYVFRCDEAPKNFILKEIKMQFVPSYKNAITSSLSGAIIKLLIDSPIFSCIFNLDKHIVASIDASEKALTTLQITSNSFIRSDGILVLPFEYKNITLENWFDDNRTGTASGVLQCFAKKELMDTFLRLHGQLQYMGVFYLLCDSLFDLAGDGGNLMVYGKAASYVSATLSLFSNLVEEFQTCLKRLDSAAQYHQRQLDDHFVKKTSADELWLDSFSKARKAYEKISSKEGDIALCKKCESDMVRAIKEINTFRYQNYVRAKINFFLSLVEVFCDSKYLLGLNKATKGNFSLKLFDKTASASAAVPGDLMALDNNKPINTQGWVESQRRKAEELIKQEQYGKAGAIYKDLRKKLPDNIDVKIDYIDYLTLQQDNENAVQEADTVIAILRKQYERAYVAKAWALYGQSKIEEGIQILEELLKIFPGIKEIVELRDEWKQDILNNKAYVFYEQGKISEAIEMLDEILRINPSSEDVQLLRKQWLGQKVAAFEKALK